MKTNINHCYHASTIFRFLLRPDSTQDKGKKMTVNDDRTIQACDGETQGEGQTLLTIIPIRFGKTWCALSIIRLMRMIVRYGEGYWRTFATTRFNHHHGFFFPSLSSTCVNRCNDDQSSSVQKWFEQKAVDRPVLSKQRALPLRERERDRSEEQVTGEGGKTKDTTDYGYQVPWRNTHARERERNRRSLAASAPMSF